MACAASPAPDLIAVQPTESEGQAQEGVVAKTSLIQQWPHLARIVLAAVVLVMLAVIWFDMAPTRDDSAGDPTSWTSDINASGLRKSANDAQTRGAPQQQVVNGWLTNDLVEVGLAQNTYMAASGDYLAASSGRNGALGATLVIGLAGWVIIGAAEKLLPNTGVRDRAQA